MNIIEAQQAALEFGLDGKCIILRDLAKIETCKGLKAIKKIECGIERLLFIYEVKEYAAKNGFEFTDRFLTSPEGKPYAACNNNIYVLTDWIEGRECDFDNITDVKTAVEALAKFHSCSKNFIPSQEIKARSELGRLPGVLKKRSEELLKLKKIAKKGKNRFDYLYVENVDFFIDRSLSALKTIESSIYDSLVKKAEKEKEICHRDYSRHNMIFDKEDRLHIINFNYCCYEIRAYDIASFLRKIMGECSWNVEVAIRVINWYDTIGKLNQDEIRIIFALLEYPQKFWRIANRYYNSKRTLPEIGFYNKLADVAAEKESYADFLEKFKEYIEATPFLTFPQS